MLKVAIDKVKEVGYERCGKCPAYWKSVDYWGEGDAGCTLHRDHLEFCPLSLLPQFVMNPYVKFEEWREAKRWDKIYEEESAKWEQEESEQVIDTLLMNVAQRQEVIGYILEVLPNADAINKPNIISYRTAVALREEITIELASQLYEEKQLPGRKGGGLCGKPHVTKSNTDDPRRGKPIT